MLSPTCRESSSVVCNSCIGLNGLDEHQVCQGFSMVKNTIKVGEEHPVSNDKIPPQNLQCRHKYFELMLLC